MVAVADVHPGSARRARGRRARRRCPSATVAARGSTRCAATIRASWPACATTRASGRRRRELDGRELGVFPFGDDAIVVILDGITDPQNLGAAARSAEAAGAAMLVTRTRRAAEVTSAAVRASAGALMHLPHARVANIARAIQRLQDAGFWVVGLDGEAARDDLRRAVPAGPRRPRGRRARATGMARLTRERCDALVALPMHGRVGSLNASASLAAALYGYVLPARGRPTPAVDSAATPAWRSPEAQAICNR